MDAVTTVAAPVAAHGGATVTCDQAIFTSVRTPMGEGYRIIAASRGLGSEERQEITRNAPSHDALCSQARDATGVAFYGLPGGRLAVSLSVTAGAEHTGRGGQRVYTHIVVLRREEFPTIGFNPFRVVRAMRAAGLDEPQLKPPGVLPELRLSVDASATALTLDGSAPPLPAPWRRYLLHQALEGNHLIVSLPSAMEQGAELLLLAMPGPLRMDCSLSAGVRFSVGRTYRLNAIGAADGITRSRVTGQKVAYFEPSASPAPPTPPSRWIDLMEGYIATGRAGTLDARCSRPFTNCSAEGRERIARVYQARDEVDTAGFLKLLSIATEHVESKTHGCEGEIVDELRAATHRALLRWVPTLSPDEHRGHWAAVLDLWRRGTAGESFARGLVIRVLESLVARDPLLAAGCAQDIARHLTSDEARERYEAAFELTLQALENRAERLYPVKPDPAEQPRPTGRSEAAAGPAAEPPDESDERKELRAMVERWRRVRPACPIVTQLVERVSPDKPG
jgi:hypothetical protein